MAGSSPLSGRTPKSFGAQACEATVVVGERALEATAVVGGWAFEASSFVGQRALEAMAATAKEASKAAAQAAAASARSFDFAMHAYLDDVRESLQKRALGGGAAAIEEEVSEDGEEGGARGGPLPEAQGRAARRPTDRPPPQAPQGIQRHPPESPGPAADREPQPHSRRSVSSALSRSESYQLEQPHSRRSLSSAFSRSESYQLDNRAAAHPVARSVSFPSRPASYDPRGTYQPLAAHRVQTAPQSWAPPSTVGPAAQLEARPVHGSFGHLNPSRLSSLPNLPEATPYYCQQGTLPARHSIDPYGQLVALPVCHSFSSGEQPAILPSRPSFGQPMLRPLAQHSLGATPRMPC